MQKGQKAYFQEPSFPGIYQPIDSPVLQHKAAFFPFIYIFRRNVLNIDSMFQTRLHGDMKPVQ